MPREAKYEGHLANSGGLQGHSVGDSYPFAVVGVVWADLDERAALADQSSSDRATRYVVLDCSTGRIYLRGDGSSFFKSDTAHYASQLLKDQVHLREELRWTSL